MKARTIAALSLLSTTVVASLGDSSRPPERAEVVVYSHDPCVLTRTPEAVCQRFLLITFDDDISQMIRIRLTAQQRVEADAWWERPENRWRRK